LFFFVVLHVFRCTYIRLHSNSRSCVQFTRSSTSRSTSLSAPRPGDEAAALAWRRVASHAQVQGKGRTEYYESYTLFAGTPSRVHHFKWDEA
jgi:hypothetical protein